MRGSRHLVVIAVGLLLLLPGVGVAKPGSTPPGLAKKGGVPPGQAKRGCLPPGLAKKLGPKAPCRVYAAVDPDHRDRIWFLVADQWVLHVDLSSDARRELEAAIRLEVPLPPPPPIPLPRVEGRLTVMLFSD